MIAKEATIEARRAHDRAAGFSFQQVSDASRVHHPQVTCQVLLMSDANIGNLALNTAVARLDFLRHSLYHACP